MLKFRTTAVTNGRSTCLSASLFPSLWGGDSGDLESSTRSPLVTHAFLPTSWVALRIQTTVWTTTLCFYCQEPFPLILFPDMTSTSSLSNMQRMVEQLKLEASVERIKVKTNSFLFIALLGSFRLKHLLLAVPRPVVELYIQIFLWSSACTRGVRLASCILKC